MATYIDYVNYFKTLAQNHVDIAHGVNNKKSFFTVDIEDLIAGLKTAASPGKFMMLFLNFDEEINAKDKGINITFFIVKATNQRAELSENDLIRDEAQKISDDILLKIREEGLANTPAVLELFGREMDSFKKLSRMPVKLLRGADHLIGYQISFTVDADYCYIQRPNKFL